MVYFYEHGGDRKSILIILLSKRGERRRRVKSRNLYTGPMDKDKSREDEYERGGWAGQGRATGEKWGQL